MSRPDVVDAAYLVAAVLFVLGLKSLARPRTASRGNLLGASAMFVAVMATLLDRAIVDFRVLLSGLVVGAAIGAVLAFRVRMTAMPQLVALFNGFGGGASVLVALASFVEMVDLGRVDSRS
ncbi:MAG: NAD(P)(+) transhydrogenase (Re/Si-specific) subunit beta, partial [Actinomycetota bacterium]|nr:NAD(P)(+) transhydrogenase (Re/Si-specific) subunit beta [Actinomycetota bacterium]